jgi:hypothetical protein
VIRLQLRHPPPLDGSRRDALSSMLRIAFAHRRKTGMRPEEVAVDRFITLSRLWKESRDGA